MAMSEIIGKKVLTIKNEHMNGSERMGDEDSNWGISTDQSGRAGLRGMRSSAPEFYCLDEYNGRQR